MKRVMDYINSAFSDLPDNKQTEKFRMKLVDEVTERANEITHAGLKNEKAIEDIIISEHPDIAEEYKEVLKEAAKKKKRRQVFWAHTVAAILYFVMGICAFVAVGAITGAWHPGWVIIVDVALTFVAFVLIRLSAFLSKSDNIIRNQIPRILLPVVIFLFATSVFLVLCFVCHISEAWVSFIFAVVVMFTVDGIYVEKTAEKFAIFFHIAYIVPAFAMFYIILSALGIVSWSLGWIMIPCSLIIVLAVICVRLYIHSKSDKGLEVDDEWQES